MNQTPIAPVEAPPPKRKPRTHSHSNFPRMTRVAREIYAVPSERDERKTHLLDFRTVTCRCEGHTHNGTCYHTEAASRINKLCAEYTLMELYLMAAPEVTPEEADRNLIVAAAMVKLDRLTEAVGKREAVQYVALCEAHLKRVGGWAE